MTIDPTKEYFAVEDHIGPVELAPMPELGEPGVDMRERWKRIVIDGLAIDYEISDYGRVLNPKGQLLKVSYPGNSSTGWINLSVDGKSKPYRVDKLVLWMFGPGQDEPDTVPVHGNGDRRDCRLANLHWGPKVATGGAKKKGTAQPKKTPPRGAIVDFKGTIADGEGGHIEYAEPGGLKERQAAEPYEHQDYVDKVVAEGVETTRRRRDRERKAAERRAKGARPRKRNSDELEVLRVYRQRGIQVTVDANGRSTISKKTSLSTEEMAALGAIATQIADMNKMMGL